MGCSCSCAKEPLPVDAVDAEVSKTRPPPAAVDVQPRSLDALQISSDGIQLEAAGSRVSTLTEASMDVDDEDTDILNNVERSMTLHATMIKIGKHDSENMPLDVDAVNGEIIKRLSRRQKKKWDSGLQESATAFIVVYRAVTYFKKRKKQQEARAREARAAARIANEPPSPKVPPSPQPDGKRIGPAPISINFTPAQKAKIEQCREAFTGAGGVLDECGDIYVARFLEAHKWNEKDTKAHLVANAKWRQEVGADKWRQGFASGELKLAHTHPKMVRFLGLMPTLTLHGFTRSNDVLKIVDFGAIDVRTFLAEFSEDEVFDINIRITEAELLACDQASLKAGHIVRIVMIGLTQSVSMKHLDLMKRTGKSGAAMPENYPELLMCAAYPQAPFAAKMAWGVMKPVMPRHIAERIYILGSANESTKVLNVLVSPKMLPAVIGGQRETWDEAWRAKMGLDDPELAAKVTQGMMQGGSVLASYCSTPS